MERFHRVFPRSDAPHGADRRLCERRTEHRSRSAHLEVSRREQSTSRGELSVREDAHGRVRTHRAQRDRRRHSQPPLGEGALTGDCKRAELCSGADGPRGAWGRRCWRRAGLGVGGDASPASGVHERAQRKQPLAELATDER